MAFGDYDFKYWKRGGDKLKNHVYTPDRTWKNVWIVLRSKKESKVVLSCKACPQGVSPKGKNYNYGMTFLCYCLGFWLPVLLYYFIIPKEWSKANKTFMILFTTVLWIPISTILVFISFHLSKWVPASADQSGGRFSDWGQGLISCPKGIEILNWLWWIECQVSDCKSKLTPAQRNTREGSGPPEWGKDFPFCHPERSASEVEGSASPLLCAMMSGARILRCAQNDRRENAL